MKKRPFLITETYTYEQHFYLLAEDEDRAEDEARNIDLPGYIDLQNASIAPEELLRTEAREAETLHIRSTWSPRQEVTLIPFYDSEYGKDYFSGYRVGKRSVNTKKVFHYQKSTWELVTKEGAE